MSTYPVAVVSTSDLPTRVDGSVIYGAHMNLVQNEVIAIEAALGVGTTLLDGFTTVVARLADFKSRIALNDTHRGATSGVHGVAGNVVGTTDVQSLTNKTLVGPTISGHIAAGSTIWDGNLAFTGNVTFGGAVTLSMAPTITDFSMADHDHSAMDQGGMIPMMAVTGLDAMLFNMSYVGHTHVKTDITDFAHTLASHSGSLDASRLTGLGTASTLDVSVTVGGTATNSQVVRGDDPRLTNARTPVNHAATHATTGGDPITPASIGAALTSHTHIKSQITDFAHTLDSHSGSLAIAVITGLQAALDGKLGTTGTAVNSAKVNGQRITVSGTAPASPAVGDVWIDY